MTEQKRRSFLTVLRDHIQMDRIDAQNARRFSAINPAECRHTEIFSQITLESGNIIPASTFIPLAQQFNLAQSFDTIVLEKVFSSSLDGKNQVELLLIFQHHPSKMISFVRGCMTNYDRMFPRSPQSYLN